MRLGLRTKFFLYSNTVVAVSMLLVTVLLTLYERNELYRETVSRGVAVAEALAVPITNAFMYEEIGLITESGIIDNYIAEILSRDEPGVIAVWVVNPDGQILYTNRWDELGDQFDRPLDLDRLDEGARWSEAWSSEFGRYIEVRSPLNVSTRVWGTLIMAFDLPTLREQIGDMVVQAFVLFLLLLLGNSIMTALYVESLIRPILDLHRLMARAGSGDLDVRVQPTSRDEVGDLAVAFNEMVAELKRARELEDLRRAQLAHTEKMAAMGTLAAGVAHEVNNPLGGILTCIEALESNPEDEDLQERYLPLIREGLKRIGRIIHNLLDFSRQRPLRPESTSLHHSLRHVMELAGYQVRKAGVQAQWELADEDPVIRADHFQMEQLFLNLILNAVQAMPGGGTLTLRTRIRVGKVEVEVEDTGTGVPEELQDRIFEPFFTTREVGEGTGLGLAVSYTIVQGHGGTIDVHSWPGEGTVFRLTFPLEVQGRRRTGGGVT
jgi:signal transduction histidine kinase